MKFYLLILTTVVAQTSLADFPLMQGPGVSDDTYRQFVEEQKMMKLTDYFKENIEYFDVRNEEVVLLNQIKESNPQKYEITLKQLKERIIKRPLTKKNLDFLCLANAELNSKRLPQTDPIELFILRLCANISSINSMPAQSMEPNEMILPLEMNLLAGMDFVLLKNGEQVDGIHKDSSEPQVNQWSFINNRNVPLVFYGNIHEFLELLKTHLDRKSTAISEGQCQAPEIKESLVSELNFQILFPENCLSKNYFDFHLTKEISPIPKVQYEKNRNWMYWGLAAVVLTAFFANSEIVIEY